MLHLIWGSAARLNSYRPSSNVIPVLKNLEVLLWHSGKVKCCGSPRRAIRSSVCGETWSGQEWFCNAKTCTSWAVEESRGILLNEIKFERLWIISSCWLLGMEEFQGAPFPVKHVVYESGFTAPLVEHCGVLNLHFSRGLRTLWEMNNPSGFASIWLLPRAPSVSCGQTSLAASCMTSCRIVFPSLDNVPETFAPTLDERIFGLAPRGAFQVKFNVLSSAIRSFVILEDFPRFRLLYSCRRKHEDISYMTNNRKAGWGISRMPATETTETLRTCRWTLTQFANRTLAWLWREWSAWIIHRWKV